MSDFRLKISNQRVCELVYKKAYIGVLTWSGEEKTISAVTVALNIIKEAFEMPYLEEMQVRAKEVTRLIVEDLVKSRGFIIESEVHDMILKETISNNIFAAMTIGLPFQSGADI